jgi:hypothetical protein
MICSAEAPSTAPKGGPRLRVSSADLGLLALALLLVLAIFRLTAITEYKGGFDWDGARYAAMAGASGVPSELAREAPFCHRVLTPWIVENLPGSGDVLGRFRRLGLWSCVLNLYLVGLLVRRHGADTLVAALAMLLHAGIFWTVKFSAYSPAYVDFQTQTFLLLVALLAPIGRARAWLVPLFVLGTLQKEALLAFVPFALLASWRARPERTLGTFAFAALLVALPLAAWLAVRIAVTPANAYDPTDPLAYLALLRDPDYRLRLVHAAISGLGLLPLVILLRPDVAWRELRAHPEWGVWLVTALALLFGGFDKERLFLYALPPLLVLASRAAGELRRRLPQGFFFAWAAVTLGVHLWLGHQLEPIPSFLDYVDRMLPLHASPRHRNYLGDDLLAVGLWAVASAALLLPAWSWGARRSGSRRGSG